VGCPVQSFLHVLDSHRFTCSLAWQNVLAPVLLCFPFVDTLLSLIILYEFFINAGAQQEQQKIK